jgi:hypothetical protein
MQAQSVSGEVLQEWKVNHDFCLLAHEGQGVPINRNVLKVREQDIPRKDFFVEEML